MTMSQRQCLKTGTRSVYHVGLYSCFYFYMASSNTIYTIYSCANGTDQQSGTLLPVPKISSLKDVFSLNLCEL